jgi:3-phenylpropionate/trans-cinnamate dioxygenase ferredoxin subunit
MSTVTRSFVPVARVGDIAEGTMKGFKVSGKAILVARDGDKYFAADSVCPHMGADLSQGKLEGTIVTCPRHASRFDLIDGRVIRWTDWTGIKARVSKMFRPPRPIVIYPVKVEGDNILVEV